MVAVRDGLVSATLPVSVAGVVAGGRRASVGMFGVDGDGMLVHVVAVRVMEMPIVQIVDVSLVDHGRVPAPLTVLMVMPVMNVVMAHADHCLRKRGDLNSLRTGRVPGSPRSS